MVPLGCYSIPFSPLIQLGKTSLLVYWVHIEFVYGRFSILRKEQQTHSDGHSRFSDYYSGDGVAVDRTNALDRSQSRNHCLVSKYAAAGGGELGFLHAAEQNFWG